MKTTYEFGPEQVELFKSVASADEVGNTARRAFAESLDEPINNRIMMESQARKVLAFESLEAGAVARYRKDPNSPRTALVIPRVGEVPTNIVAVDEIFLPTFQMADSFEIPYYMIRDARFNIVQGEIDGLVNSFVRAENNMAIALMKSATGTPVSIGSETTASKVVLNTILKEFTTLAMRRYTPDCLVMSPRRFTDIRMWGASELSETDRHNVFQAGGLPAIWDIPIVLIPECNDNDIYCLDISKFGVMAQRQGVTIVEDPSGIARLVYKVIAYEEIGMASIDVNAIKRVQLP